MKNEPLWNKTVDILVKAYLGDTLEHFNCYACAVGNLIAGNCGYKYRKPEKPSIAYYTGMGLLTFEPPLKFSNNLVRYLKNSWESPTKTALHHLKKTGYSFEELIRIEEAFEGVPQLKNKDKYMFNGLMSVIDTLMQIHEATDTEAEEAKGLFRKELTV